MAKKLRVDEDSEAPQADVKVTVEGETLWMYSQILMLSSPVFRTMLQGEMEEAQTT